jgi:hypothetical protein
VSYVIHKIDIVTNNGHVRRLRIREALAILYMTNKMGHIMIFIINNALSVSGVYRPSSGAHEMYMQPMVQMS